MTDIMQAHTAEEFSALISETLEKKELTDPNALSNLCYIKRAAAAEQKKLEGVIDAVRASLGFYFESTGESKVITTSGTAQIIPEKTTDFIDIKTIEQENPALWNLLLPYQKQRTTKSYIDIR